MLEEQMEKMREEIKGLMSESDRLRERVGEKEQEILRIRSEYREDMRKLEEQYEGVVQGVSRGKHEEL